MAAVHRGRLRPRGFTGRAPTGWTITELPDCPAPSGHDARRLGALNGPYHAVVEEIARSIHVKVEQALPFVQQRPSILMRAWVPLSCVF